MAVNFFFAAVVMFAVVVSFLRRPFSLLATGAVIGSIMLVLLGGAVSDGQGWIVSERPGSVLLGVAAMGACVLAAQPRRRPLPRPLTWWTRGWHGLVGGIVAAALGLGVYFAMSVVALVGTGPDDPLLNDSTLGVLLLVPFVLVLGVVFGASYSSEESQQPHAAAR